MPIFLFCSPQAVNFWNHRGFEWKAINNKMGSFLITSFLHVYVVMMSSSTGEWGSRCYVAACLRQAVTCLWVWVPSSLWYALCQVIIRDWWKLKVSFRTSSKLMAGKMSCGPNSSSLFPVQVSITFITWMYNSLNKSFHPLALLFVHPNDHTIISFRMNKTRYFPAFCKT